MARKATKKTAKKSEKKPSPLKGRTKTPPYPNYPLWSQARFFSFLRSALRGAYNRYPVKFDVLKAARRDYQGTDKRTKWQFKCAGCGEWFLASQVSVDHIVPAGSLNTFADLPGFCERLFCGQEGLQVLCSAVCHKNKTALERSKKDE